MNKAKNIKQFINSLTKNNIANIKLKKGNTKILVSKVINDNNKLNKEIKFNKVNKIEKINKINFNLEEKNINKKQIEEDKTSNKISALYSTIISPMVGTFYRSPAPNEDAFIEIGEIIKSKQIVCIIEAMKLMNEIESEIKGEVVDILVKDGDIVDCGQALMKIKIK
uniref:Biotin carboxyl carrier protein of acetyl-CoA carboxylase n=1 Tax=Leptosiphonia brodiei TaxID=2608611 RepID=A0A1Z1MAC9_9FLOR|nr:acetyl-CoA carboxylase biotin carboxyl carrier protein [Leptosiphonia brodiei]ARW62930.1 acetyl-CoA carboxylase biotin carboxyl carrier protein [Leptosiphonia brodiei]